MGPKRPDKRSEKPDLGSKGPDLGSERPEKRFGGLSWGLRGLISRPERLYWVLVLGLQYSCVLGFPNTCSLFCYFTNTIQYYTIL